MKKILTFASENFCSCCAMVSSNEMNRIFWGAAVECRQFGCEAARNPSSPAEKIRWSLFELARSHAALDGCPLSAPCTAGTIHLEELKRLLPDGSQRDQAVAAIDRLAAIAVHLRERQAQATDTESTPPARSQAQADVDNLLALRNKTSEEVELLVNGAPEAEPMWRQPAQAPATPPRDDVHQCKEY